MSISSSSPGKLPLPRWAYVRGATDEADADYETLAQAKLLVPARFQDIVPARHPALRYGLTLNDSGYFWEAQEVLKAVWAADTSGRPRANPAAGLHPDRQRQSPLADGQTSREIGAIGRI